MRNVIEGKHLGKVTTVDMRTGKKTPSDTKMFMMPAKKGTCEECAVDHKPNEPHDAQSLFYQYRFYNEHGRWPNWKDAYAHCDEETKSIWKLRLEEAGVEVDAGNVHPSMAGAARKGRK